MSCGSPPYENEELLAKNQELKAEWDPKLREAMDEIAARADARRNQSACRALGEERRTT